MSAMALTGIIGIGLLLCGYMLGYSRASKTSSSILSYFISEMITSGLLDPVRLSKYYKEILGLEVDFSSIKGTKK